MAKVLYTAAMAIRPPMDYPRGVKTLALALAVLMPSGSASAAAPSSGVWVTGYYPGWRQSRMAPADIDYGALTHVIHFSVVPREDGSLNAAVNLMTPANVKAAVTAAHAAGRKILFSVGGQNSRSGFVGAMSAPRRAAFVEALLAYMSAGGYDGIDVDMEEVRPEDARDFTRFILELRAKLDRIEPRPLLTAAVLWEPRLFARLAANFDQMNLMTYNLSGPYPGWVVWHSGALYDGGRRFPDGETRLPSVDGLVDRFSAAGVPREKLGIGLSYNGYIWRGPDVKGPGEGWQAPPAMKTAPYFTLAETYGIREHDETSPGYRWDARAQAAYLSIPAEGSEDPLFVSYDNAASARAKLDYVRTKGLGGVIVWDLAAGFRSDQPAGSRDVLLQALKNARLGSQGGAR